MSVVDSSMLLDKARLLEFCAKWKIKELALFGSVMRSDFGPESDIDIMVEFAPEAQLGVWDLYRAKEELEDLTGRKVDLVEKGTVVNPYRKASIERDLAVVYSA